MPSEKTRSLPRFTVAALLGSLAVATAAQELVTFPSTFAGKDGKPERLIGFVERPAGQGPFPALIFMHGCSGLFGADGRMKRYELEWAAYLRARGFVVLFVDSNTPRGYGDLCPIQGPARPVQANRERPADAYGALFYLQRQPDVIPNAVGLVGWSNGGNALLHVIASDAPARPKTLPHGDFRAAVAFYPGGCEQALKARWMTRIPLLMLLGEKDDWTGAKPCLDLAEDALAQGARITTQVYPGAYHGFDELDEPLRVRSEVVLPALASRDQQIFPAGRSPMFGSNAAAHRDALERVPAFLASQFGIRQ
jgi:dienelactone hydrolase